VHSALSCGDPDQDTGHYDPSFTLDLCLKDLGLIQDLQDGLHADLPLTEAARDVFTLAAQRYGAQAAELHVAKRIEDDGLSFRLPGDWTPPWNRPTRNHCGPKACLIVRPSGIVKVPGGAGQRALTFLLYSCSPSAALRAASSATLTARRSPAAPSPSTPGLPSYAMTHLAPPGLLRVLGVNVTAAPDQVQAEPLGCHPRRPAASERIEDHVAAAADPPEDVLVDLGRLLVGVHRFLPCGALARIQFLSAGACLPPMTSGACAETISTGSASPRNSLPPPGLP
jgi:NAD-binding of NADP-dependent 3-hydroxyisobutyrate dehydrogenase